MMGVRMRCARAWLRNFMILQVLCPCHGMQFAVRATPDEKRDITVADVIRMTRIGEPLQTGYTGVGPKTGFAEFSPDEKRFALIVVKGNLTENTNEYSLLLFDTVDIKLSPTPKLLVTFASSSNDEGISDLSWLDNDVLLFVGARGSEAAQLYSIHCDTRELRKLTDHRAGLESYAVSGDGETIVYMGAKSYVNLVNEQALRDGFNVATESLWDLLTGKIATEDSELFVHSRSGDRRLDTQGPLHSGFKDLSLSPDGRYLILKTDVKELHEAWKQYRDVNIQTAFRRRQSKGSTTLVMRYELIDVRTGRSEFLLDSPAPFLSSDVIWSPDSRSVLLCGTHLPFDVVDPVEFEERRSEKYVVEIELAGKRVTKIAIGDLRPIRWTEETNIVQFQVRDDDSESVAMSDPIYYRKLHGSWQRTTVGSATAENAVPEIHVDQDLNTPPRIVAVDPRTKQQTELMELNPEFDMLRFARVEEIRWTDNTGKPVIGGLYYPVRYIAGQRYPLVIQTHGFEPHEFWIDGPYPTAAAAQVLATRGIAVLQVNDAFYDSRDTPQESERATGAYENAIDLLDKMGIVDRDRVGLEGFSRTCLYVKYALTHSNHRFAAAIVSDGLDAGYFQYVLGSPLVKSEFETLIGAPPFGDGLTLWEKKSPGFSLEKVNAPVQIQANGPFSLLGQWEWFSGLKRLDKPVELMYLPTGGHILVKPWDRMVSQQRSVDWFCYWLKGEQDHAPEKAAQYVRWSGLRKQLGDWRPASK